MGCKWASLNAPGTGKPRSHPLLGLGDNSSPLLKSVFEICSQNEGEVLIKRSLSLPRIPYQSSRLLRKANQMHDE